MQRLGDFFFRLIGPILFSAAFLLFVSNYNVVKQYLDTVKSGFVEGEVYEQSNVDTNDRIYKFKSDGSYEVDGSYLAGILSGSITDKIIIVGNKYDYFQRLEINPRLSEDSIMYTAYQTSLQPNSINKLKAVSAGAWVAGQSFDLNKIISYSSKYKVKVSYYPTNAIKNITYTKIS